SSRDEALRYAAAGDWAPLAKYIRNGGRVTPQMRPFLADVLDRTGPRPRGKVRKLAAERKKTEITLFILQERRRGRKEKEYSEAAEKKFGRTWRHLQKIFAERKRAGKAELTTRLDHLLLDLESLWGKLGINTSNKDANRERYIALMDDIIFCLKEE